MNNCFKNFILFVFKAGIFQVPFLFLVFNFSMEANTPENEIIKHEGDTISFSGYKWVTKETYEQKTGPGDNYFSGKKENVYVDENGKLHLRLTNRNDKWYCPEVRLVDRLGYGKYYFHVDRLPQTLDKDIVIGLFVYDLHDSTDFHREVDIEFSTWGTDTLLNSQYVLQPKVNEAYRFQTDFNMGTKHMIDLRRHRIMFKSEYEEGLKNPTTVPYTSHTMLPDHQYRSKNERVIFNVWLYHTSEPSNLQEFEIIISKFEFEKLKWYENILYNAF